MSLLQINEPGSVQHSFQHRLAAGIDLGTTNSLIATVIDGKVETLADSKQRYLLPSVVHFGQQDITVGYVAQNGAIADPQNTISSVKRLIGRRLSEIQSHQLPYRFTASENELPYVLTHKGSVNAIQVSAEILKKLVQRAEKALNGALEGVVITVPAYFNDAQRQATKDAATLAGLTVLRLINEPTAAALAYGLESQQKGVIVVYDLGGGTFDLSILRLNKGIFEVLATGGDSALGGDDFDQIIIDYVCQQIPQWQQVNNPFLLQQLREQAIATKIALSEQQEAQFCLDDVCITIRRTDFQQLIEPLIKKTLIVCKKALRDAQLSIENIEQVIMVGGATRVPAVRENVAKFFGCQPLTSIDPDKVVAIGAAIQADILIGNKPDSEMLLLDVIPLSLGIETMGGLVEKIIPRNTTIPCSRAQEFTTFKDGQTAMRIHILQGERETVDECRSLAHFTLHNIPSMSAGSAHIRVIFQVDADGLLSVTAQEKLTNVQTSVQVKPAYGLTDKEIATMIADSMQYAGQDLLMRKLAEAKVEALRVINSVQTALLADGDLLSTSEKKVIDEAIRHLQASTEQNDSDSILAATKELDLATQIFAERRMNHAIKQALSGQSVDHL